MEKEKNDSREKPSGIPLNVNCTKRMGKQDMTGKMEKRVTVTRRAPKAGLVVSVAAALMLVVAPVAESAFFETSGKSARSIGMGEVFLSMAGEAASYWYNPAGLSKAEGREVGLSYGLPVATISDLSISQVNFVTPLGENGGLGFGISYGGVDVANDMALTAGYGVNITDRLSLGGNLKLLRWAVEGQQIRGGVGVDDDLSKVSFSFDLSAMYGLGDLFGLGDFFTGVYLKDPIMPNISESGDDGGKLPLEAGVGLMMRRGGILAEGNIAHRDGNTFLRFGSEYGLQDSGLAVRGGLLYGGDFKDETEQFDLNLGLGYNFGAIGFNYAYVVPFEMRDVGGKHFVSFGVSF